MGDNADITISIIARDLASGNIGKAVSGLDALAKKGGLVGAMAQGVGQSFGQMLNPIGLVKDGIGMVTDFLGNAARAAMDEETNIQRLNTTLKDNVTNWDGNTTAIEDQIAQREKLAFSDDALRDSLGTLVIRTHDVNQAFQDQVLAMDIARGKNIDLASATDIVNKAALGNTKALKAMGIEVDKNATSTEILTMLQKKFSGQAEEYADSTKGTMESMQIALQDVSEDIGKALLPAMKDLALFVRDTLIPAIGTVADVLGTGGHVAHEFFNIISLGAVNSREAIEGLQNQVKAIEEQYGVTEGALRAWMQAHPDLVAAAGSDYTQLAALATQAAQEISKQWQADDLRESARLGAQATMWAAEHAITAAKPDLAAAMNGAIDVGVVDVIHSAKTRVGDAMDDLKWAMLHPLEGLAELARIQAELTGSELAAGLASENPFIQAQAQATRDILLEEWRKISGVAYNQGFNAQREYSWGLQQFRMPTLNVHFPGGVKWADPNHPGYVPGMLGGYTPPIGGGNKKKRHRATGGPVAAGEGYVVGEDQAEWFVPDSDGYVFPEVPRTQPERSEPGSRGNSGTLVFNFNYHGLTPPTPAEGQRIAQAFMPELVREMRRQRVI